MTHSCCSLCTDVRTYRITTRIPIRRLALPTTFLPSGRCSVLTEQRQPLQRRLPRGGWSSDANFLSVSHAQPNPHSRATMSGAMPVRDVRAVQVQPAAQTSRLCRDLGGGPSAHVVISPNVTQTASVGAVTVGRASLVEREGGGSFWCGGL